MPVLKWGILQFPRLCLIYVVASIYQVNLHRISICMSGQHRHSRNLRISIPLFSIVSDSDFQIPAHPSLSLREQDQEVCHRQSLLSNPFTAVVMTALDGVNGTVCNATQYQQSLQSYDSRTPSISCLKHGESIGLVVSI
jgi:hypothetical protein